MKVEIPKFKRCCFCIPLRYGLLVWGYIKLVLTLVVFLFGALIMQMYLQFVFMMGFGGWLMMFVGVIMLFFLMVDIGMTIVFLIGGHGKTAKLLKIFYVYSIVLLCIMSLLLFISTIYDLSVGDNYDYRYRHYGHHTEILSYGAMVTLKVVGGIFFLGVQAYVILLIRSEIDKLANSRNFRFNNIANDAECTMVNRNLEHAPATQEQNNTTGHRELEEDDKLGSYKNIRKTDSNQGTFNYGKF